MKLIYRRLIPHYNKIFTILRHGFVSVICGGLEYSSFLLFYVHIKMPIGISYICAYLIATLTGFTLHNYFTFKVKKLKLNYLIRFILQSLSVLTIGYFTVSFLINKGITPQIAKLIQLFLTFSINVIVGRYFTFKK